MPSSIDDYRKLIDLPFGRIFYDIVFMQLNIDNKKRYSILDFGGGFCVTSNHYAQHHNVIAYEPDENMLKHKVRTNEYKIISSFETLKDIPSESFDIIICHNVLEYVKDKESILDMLSRLLKPNGTLSIVKHNDYGRVLASAVFDDSPSDAINALLLKNTNESMFGNRYTYSNEWLISFLLKSGIYHTKTYGIRAFYGLSSNNEIKFTDEWYKNMLELEIRASDIEAFTKIAFFNHLLFTKE